MTLIAPATKLLGVAETVIRTPVPPTDPVRVMMIELVEPLPRVALTISSTSVPETFVPALYVADMLGESSPPSCIGIVIEETLAPPESMKLAPLLFTGMVKVIV
jgi:hypothetical protein